MMNKHPIQPLVLDGRGVLRFKENAIVRYLLDCGGIDMNRIAQLDFSQEDREQFAQLIGYSLSGAGDLDYVTDEVFETAREIYEDPSLVVHEARLQALRDDIKNLKYRIRQAIEILE